MSALLDDFKNVWTKPNNALMQIIVLNIIVFTVINIIYVISVIAGEDWLFVLIAKGIFIPAAIGEYVWRPWTLITYFFTHQNPLHILFNMLILYWFGMIVRDYLGNSKLIALYAWGGIVGGVLYLICFNTIPYFMKLTPQIGIKGADAAVYAIVVGAATYRPHLQIHMLFFGAIKIVYIAAVVVILSFIGVASYSSDAGMATNLAELGGALLGYIFVRQYEKGRDWSIPIEKVLNSIRNIFRPSSSNRNRSKAYSKASTSKGSSAKAKGGSFTSSATPSQDEIDMILDKISAHGYESLTTEEKQILFKASQKK
ncbi:rhomboid family intramembrane serine protease [Thermoflexibacter ruber]|uniref:Membrane associated serine protease, rhomboid family n=1 Tax=Thermoflexibacter ruber TaxID=1003 RepID=A0A1I2J4W5_9BACT|nr:rhomboid family intramembrane serine protease [Thermoflexibacter ruber]SFF49802.1 Membrane associated serine protease, rhomboid family [Thermoflexibacter ruber]